MPPNEAGASPPAAARRPGRSGPTRAAPIVLLVLAGVLLAARVALGVYEHVTASRATASPADGR